MKVLALASVLVSIWAAPAHAADLPLQVPAGWDGHRQEGAFLMTPRDVGGGKAYTVLVIDLAAKVGSTKGLLDAATATLGQVGTFRAATAPAHGRNDQGWEYDVVIGTLQKDGKSLMAQAMGLKHGDDEGAILVISDSVETMQRYSDPFTAMIRGLGAGSAAPAPAAAPAVASGAVDLQYTVPAGWTSKPIDGGVMLEKTENTLYDKYTWRLVILPSQPLTGSLRQAFVDDWTAMLAGAFESQIAPLPFMRRLKSGMVVAYDLDTGAKTKSNGQMVSGGMWLLASGNRVVPILVFFFGGMLGEKLEADMTALVESAQIPKAGTGRVSMFASADLVGDWTTSSSSIASYVTPSGGYAGDASIATSEQFTLRADGGFTRSFLGISRGASIRESDSGTWKLDDAWLREHGKEDNSYQVLAASADPRAGAFLVIGTYSGAPMIPRLCNPRGAFQGTWFKRK